MDDATPIGEPGVDVDVGEFCRLVEAHLARVNAGEIIRITGVGFELVRGWALEGIPLSIVCHGVTLKAERHRTGASARALRIEFCTADVRAEYVRWRRAVGMPARAAADDQNAAPTPTKERRRPSLTQHLQRAVDRLSRSASRLDLAVPVRDVLNAALAELAALSERSAGARGPARDAILAALQALDARLLTAAREAIGAGELERLAADAASDLGGYRGRLAPDAWQRSVDLGVDRLLRDRLGLPTLEL